MLAPFASQTVSTGPPDTSIFINLVMSFTPGKAMNRLSGDHVIEGEATVSARRRGSVESSERIHRDPRPVDSLAKNATLLPSGDTANLCIVVPGGAEISNLTSGDRGAPSR